MRPDKRRKTQDFKTQESLQGAYEVVIPAEESPAGGGVRSAYQWKSRDGRW
jgi:hypothetical protein